VVLIVVSIISFLILYMIPGDPVAAMLGIEATPAKIEAVRHELWFDRPLPVQYVHWLGNVFHGQFGMSLVFHKDVSELMKQRLPVTLYLNFWAFIISIVLGIGVGIISAVRRGGWLDNLMTIFANAGVATPIFWLGILGIYLLGLKLGWLPIQGFVWPTVDFVKSIKQSIMPVICLALPFLAMLARQTRSSMLEVVRQDYIQTAKGKGLSEKVIIFKHALKNACIPVATLIGLETRVIIGGSVLVETVFNINGMGRMITEATLDKDYLVVQGSIVILSVIICLANLAVDISYTWLDPRIKYE
jgi:peptide/nickel transport system permease protein